MIPRLINLTTDQKIEETEYNLEELNKQDAVSKEFKFVLSNFLSSAQSILYHLLEEYNVKYKLQLKRVNLGTFKKRAKKYHNSVAIHFIDWYEDELKKITKERSYGFLIDKRHLNVHKAIIKPQGRLTIESFTVPAGKEAFIDISSALQKGAKHTKVTFVDNTTGQTEEIEIGIKNVRFFEENPTQDAITLCMLFLDKLKRIVKDANSLF